MSSKTPSKARRINVTSAKTVPAKRTHLSMKAFDVCENQVVKVEVAGNVHLVKSDSWYVAYPAVDGAIGYPWIHCLVKKGVALFATQANYMRPRMYKPLNELLDPSYNAFERRS
jgi:hypothetical protein